MCFYLKKKWIENNCILYLSFNHVIDKKKILNVKKWILCFFKTITMFPVFLINNTVTCACSACTLLSISFIIIIEVSLEPSVLLLLTIS